MNALTIRSPKGGKAIVVRGRIVRYQPSEHYWVARITFDLKNCAQLQPTLDRRVCLLDMRRYAVAQFMTRVGDHFQSKKHANHHH
jgi:hypothetical protein